MQEWWQGGLKNVLEIHGNIQTSLHIHQRRASLVSNDSHRYDALYWACVSWIYTFSEILFSALRRKDKKIHQLRVEPILIFEHYSATFNPQFTASTVEY